MSDGFAEIGRRAGPIDWAMLPIGAYEPRWFMKSQHIDPREAVDAAIALRARELVAMHRGASRLTDDPIGEPPELVREAWREREQDPARLWVMSVGESRRLATR